jgi:hypothetical protein
LVGLYGCTKQDLNTNLVTIKENNRSKFFNNNGGLSPNVEKVLNNAKVQMTDKQIDDFITKAGMIYWDNAKSYSISVIANTSNATSSGDSIVILPVALPNDNNINAVLVARLLANGYDITYSIHYKSEYKSIDSTFLPAYNITAKELYLLGMAQLDFEVFGHKFFLLNDKSVTFGQPITGTGEQLKYIGVNQGPSCLYTFTYYPFVGSIPIPFWAYSVPGDCSITNISLPPAIFLEGLDDTYGNGSGSSSVPLPEGGGGPASPYSLQFSVFYQSLSASQKTFLEDAANNEYYNGFINYLVLHQFSQEATDHIIWCINYLLSPTTLVQNYAAFAAVYLNDFPSLSFLSQDEINWLNNYPYLKSRVYYFLQHSSTILNAEQKVQFHINKMRTESSYLLFNTNYSQHTEFLNLWFNDVNYLFDFGGVAFGEWAINYLIQNPLVNIVSFQNQFMGSSEGEDGDYDSNYWDNPNNIYPPQSLPTWASFEAAYPKSSNGGNMLAPDVYNYVGGDIKALRDGVLNDNNPNNDNAYDNACALRMSRALNYSGITIPNIPNKTFKGGDNKYYFLGAANLNRWMRKTFGCANPNVAIGEYNNSNASHFNTSQIGLNGENLPTLLLGKKGIYTIVTNPEWASGHCDMLYSDATCIGNCHFADPETIYYCDVWNLQ